MDNGAFMKANSAADDAVSGTGGAIDEFLGPEGSPRDSMPEQGSPNLDGIPRADNTAASHIRTCVPGWASAAAQRMPSFEEAAALADAAYEDLRTARGEARQYPGGAQAEAPSRTLRGSGPDQPSAPARFEPDSTRVALHVLQEAVRSSPLHDPVSRDAPAQTELAQTAAEHPDYPMGTTRSIRSGWRRVIDSDGGGTGASSAAGSSVAATSVSLRHLGQRRNQRISTSSGANSREGSEEDHEADFGPEEALRRAQAKATDMRRHMADAITSLARLQDPGSILEPAPHGQPAGPSRQLQASSDRRSDSALSAGEQEGASSSALLVAQCVELLHSSGVSRPVHGEALQLELQRMLRMHTERLKGQYQIAQSQQMADLRRKNLPPQEFHEEQELLRQATQAALQSEIQEFIHTALPALAALLVRAL